jgi:hypothetical protein
VVSPVRFRPSPSPLQTLAIKSFDPALWRVEDPGSKDPSRKFSCLRHDVVEALGGCFAVDDLGATLIGETGLLERLVLFGLLVPYELANVLSGPIAEPGLSIRQQKRLEPPPASG